MLHYIAGIAQSCGEYHYLINNGGVGVRAFYGGQCHEGEWYLYPIIDDNHKTVFYYAFDTNEQLDRFTTMAKIAGVGPKLAFALTNVNESDLHNAISTMDMKFLQSIPGVGPKLAKRLLVEFKESLTSDDIAKLNIDRALYRDIITTLTNLGYKTTKIDVILQSCPYELHKSNLAEIMKYVITQAS